MATNRFNLPSNLFEYPYNAPCFKVLIGIICILKCIGSILGLVYFVDFTSTVILLDLIISVGLSCGICWMYYKAEMIESLETFDIRQTYYVWLRRMLCIWSIIEFVGFMIILVGAGYIGTSHYADPSIIMSVVLSVLWFTFLYIILTQTWSTYENIGDP